MSEVGSKKKLNHKKEPNCFVSSKSIFFLPKKKASKIFSQLRTMYREGYGYKSRVRVREKGAECTGKFTWY